MQKHQSSPKTCTLPFFVCFLSSLVKRQLNNEKVRQIKGRSTKIAAAFIQYKANFKNIKISVSSFQTCIYEILPAGSGKNQTQFKPNTNPIAEKQKMSANQYKTMNYKISPLLAVKKTNPIQTQSKPKKIWPEIFVQTLKNRRGCLSFLTSLSILRGDEDYVGENEQEKVVRYARLY